MPAVDGAELTPREVEVLHYIAEDYSNQEIANAMGCDVKALVWALAQPAPFPLKPLNWTASPAAGAVAPYIGVTPIAYAGPSTPGYTYGAPLAAREDFS